jgi:hypothetical protein
VALALSACVKQAGRPLVLQGLRDVRLRRPLRPGDEVEVILTEGKDAAFLRFEIRCLGETVTDGLFVFNPDHDGGRG